MRDYMNKQKVYENIYKMINDGLFLNKYIELTKDISLLDLVGNEFEDNLRFLENVSASIFNSILIGCQLFDDENLIVKFVDTFSSYLNSNCLAMFLEDFGLTEQEACNRLIHGFGVHFTTPKICDEIIKCKKLVGFGKNAMFTKDEDEIIKQASMEQIANNKDTERTMNYLFRGWGTGVSSYSSMTNGFWMYHTPESLTFLFGDISKRNKKEAMLFVENNVSALSLESRKKVLIVMSNIYDRLIGEEQQVGCILIDRDAFKYEVDYYYNNGTPIAIERRPYSNNNLNSLDNSDSKISNDIDINYLRFLKIPTVLNLEMMKQEMLKKSNIK